MANLQPQSTTDRFATDLLDEEDERERVLLVVLVRGGGALTQLGSESKFANWGQSQISGNGVRVNSGELGSESKFANWGQSQIAGNGVRVNSGELGSESPNGMTGNELVTYAMNVSAVREVIRARAVTRVPGTPTVMSGLVNVRGMVVTVLDLAACLEFDNVITPSAARGPIADGVTEARAQTTGSIVLLEHGGRLVGLAVHGVRDVRPLDDAGLVSEHSVLAESEGIKRGLASAGGEVVTLLDVAALLSRHLISSGET